MSTATEMSGNNPQLFRLLNQHFGSGEVYLTSSEQRPILHLAIKLGLVNKEGFLTPIGQRVWAQHPHI